MIRNRSSVWSRSILLGLLAGVSTSILIGGIATPAVATISPPEAAPAIVINEIAAASSVSETDSFFELRNASEGDVDLSGWSVFRCDERGLRMNLGRPEVSLTGVVLAPGEIFTAAHMSARRAAAAADARFAKTYASRGLGLVLIRPDGATADAVAVYPNEPWPTQSECAPTPNLPATLAAVLDESWQRTDAGAWVRATSTPGEPNAQRTAATAPRSVVVSELAAAGPGGRDDDLVELHNTTGAAIDTAGWRLYRCTGLGEARPDTLQLDLAPGSTLEAGERLVIGGPGAADSGGPRTATSLADATSGVLLVDDSGRRVDGVSLSAHSDTACQSGDAKLDPVLDYRGGESWQRTDGGSFVRAPRTAGLATETPTASVLSVSDGFEAGVAITEFAVDPVLDLPEGVARSHFIELGNLADEARDIGGWRLVGCGFDGFPENAPQVEVPPGTVLEPGSTWTAALHGTDAARTAGAVFAEAFDFRGAGVMLEDPAGGRIDGVGAYHVNEMDRSIDTPSSCTSGLTLTVFAVDRLRGETFQRAQQTGDNTADFVVARATPGVLADRRIADPRELVLDAVRALTGSAPAGPTAEADAVPDAAAPAAAADVSAVVEAFAGSSAGPLTTRQGAAETRVPAGTAPSARDDGFEHPYVRLLVAADGPGTLSWQGVVLGRTGIRMSAWDHVAGSWRALDDTAVSATAGVPEAATRTSVALSGALRGTDIVDGRAEVLVQAGPLGESPLSDDEPLAAPSDYDFAFAHLTDTQYLVEAYPEVYADMVGWVIANADPRKIAFSVHTGDLIQNWVDPDQPIERARREYETASAIQSVLDDAGVANSVLPGNHDTKRGIDSDLFNRYFGPDRYADTPWYGDSIGPDDNTANYSTFTVQGARMLMLSLPYGYGEREVVWAGDVVTRHPGYNVVIATHEHVMPKTLESVAHRSSASRWLSRADDLWSRVIAPNRNVVAVLSGHYHGLGQIITEDAGGIPGHTVVEILADYQEFRTHTGERATGFSRLLQVDLAGGRIAVDALSATLDEETSAPYDYEQFVRDDGHESTPSNDRPWEVVADGLQRRYTAADDHFTIDLALQHPKGLETGAVSLSPDAGSAGAAGAAVCQSCSRRLS